MKKKPSEAIDNFQLRTKELHNFQQRITSFFDNKPADEETTFLSATDQINEFEKFVVQTAKEKKEMKL
jgi:hypothetical protein